MHPGACEDASEKKIGSVRYLLLHMASDEDSMHVSGRGGAPTHFQTYKIIEKNIWKTKQPKIIMQILFVR